MEIRDLKTQYRKNKLRIDSAIQRVLATGCFIGGDPVQELEIKLAEYVGVKHCITCANGTDALQLALMAWGIGEGDAVFVPDFTFFSTAEVVPWVKATPVFVDVEKDTFNMSAQSLERAIREVAERGELTPKVVIAVDLFGQPADYPAIRDITDKYGLMLLEDGAQGFGGRIYGSNACSFGDISTTSFFPAKPLGCYGDGGAVFTNNDEWARLVRSYKVHGKGETKYDNVRIGMNSRLDTIQAAILLEKLDIFADMELGNVNCIAERYTEHLKDIAEVPAVKDGFYSSWAQYTLKVRDNLFRTRLQRYLSEHGISSMIYYPKPLHRQDAFIQYRDWDEKLKNTIDLCDRVISIPIHPYLEDEECDTVIENIVSFNSGFD